MTAAEPQPDVVGPGRLAEYAAERRAVVARLRAQGVDPYPTGVRTSHRLAEVRAAFDGTLAPGAGSGVEVTVGGRLVGRRASGRRLVFLVLREGDDDLQVLAEAAVLGEAGMAGLGDLDVGDWVAVTGEVVASRRGELSVAATAVVLAGKALRPLPDTWHGLRDLETRFRQREVDLTVNAEARRVFGVRARVIRTLRRELEARGFVEVETPMLHPLPGGATARPFVTHHNALDVDLYLRIAPELYLKRLVAGGLTRVFEVNRSYRNEGLSPRHNPEFTMLESYQAFADYTDARDLTQALVRAAAGADEVTYQGRAVPLGPEPWRWVTLLDLVREATGRADLDYGWEVEDARALCAAHDVPVEPDWGTGKLVVELYEKLAEPHLWAPTFVADHPLETSPLARPHRSAPHVTERFELVVVGRELANAFSELTDPDEQRRRLEAQAAARAGGDGEAMTVDEAYLRAMELGMPPMGGLGVGVDRLVMLLADVATIRDVILFPTLRPEA